MKNAISFACLCLVVGAAQAAPEGDYRWYHGDAGGTQIGAADVDSYAERHGVLHLFSRNSK